MSGGEVVYYVAVAAAAAGALVEADNANIEALERARILEQELKTEELRALDQENQRLIELRLANDLISVNAGGVDPYASPSLVAGRKFNFRMFSDDQAAAQLNLGTIRASTSAQIRIFNRNARVALQTGILSAISTIGFGAAEGGLLGKPKPPKIPTGGAGGANATRGIGHLDLPGANPANGILG
jgi:hypothetical protein